MLVRSLGKAVRILAVRVSRTGMNLRFFVLTLIVVMHRLTVVMCGRLVF